MQSVTGSLKVWLLRHSFVFICAGLVVFFSSWPVSSLFQLSAEEYANMADYTLSTGLPYKGKDFLEWRYGWLGVMFMMWFTALALFLTGPIFAWLRLRLEPEIMRRTLIGAILNRFKLKHTTAQT
jgi:hypothetical protein